MTLKKTAIHPDHVRLGAKLVEFGGWEMPLSYPSGTIAEHLATRSRAAMFDVSHLGTVRLRGLGTFELLQQTLTNDLRKITPGRAQYTHLVDQATGSVIDDIILWWIKDDIFDVMPNASNTSRVLRVLPGTDITQERSIIAVQGPQARSIVSQVVAEAGTVPHFGVVESSYLGESIILAGTGYTGEDGIELAIPNTIASLFWNKLLDIGITPAGLGARDTLRLEAGLPLHGHELGEGITPFQAGLAWVVAFNKPSFRGREALLAEKNRGIQRKLVGLKGHTRQPLRQDQEIAVDERTVGFTTSGNYSPVLQVGIAMGFVEPECEIGQHVQVLGKGKAINAEIVSLPFVKKVNSGQTLRSAKRSRLYGGYTRRSSKS